MRALTKRLHGLAFAAIAVATSLAAPSFVKAQSADLVLCDRLAADPADPDKPADIKGTPDVAPSDIATAIKYCRIASVSSRRAMYQLGRAYAANRQMPDAMGAWRKAADKGARPRRWSSSACSMAQALALPGTRSRRASYSSAQRKPAIRAASAILPRSPAAVPRGPIRCDPAIFWRKPRPLIPKRSINSD
jgi:hypothetical protein